MQSDADRRDARDAVTASASAARLNPARSAIDVLDVSGVVENDMQEERPAAGSASRASTRNRSIRLSYAGQLITTPSGNVVVPRSANSRSCSDPTMTRSQPAMAADGGPASGRPHPNRLRPPKSTLRAPRRHLEDGSRPRRDQALVSIRAPHHPTVGPARHAFWIRRDRPGTIPARPDPPDPSVVQPVVHPSDAEP